MIPEKLEECPDCGNPLDQQGYAPQSCIQCRWNPFKPRPLPKLPDKQIPFEFFPRRFLPRWVRVIEFRRPRKGENYLSGAIVVAYLAPNDLSTPFWICEALPPKPVHLHEHPRSR